MTEAEAEEEEKKGNHVTQVEGGYRRVVAAPKPVDIVLSLIHIYRFYRTLEVGTAGLRGVIGAGTNRMNIYTRCV